MYKEKSYPNTRFSADALHEAYQTFVSCHASESDECDECEHRLSIRSGRVEWGYNSIEEFLVDYRNEFNWAYMVVEKRRKPYSRLSVSVNQGRHTRVNVSNPERLTIKSIFAVFEKHADTSQLPPEPTESVSAKPEIFIGHGRNLLWRDLKDHLQDQHGFDVLAYEIGARAGHAIRDILEEMLGKGTFAILVMTGEDETKNDQLMPRMNVVHELGLFQGRLGFSKAIVLLEQGTQEFSNIHGTHQIRFTKGNIRETFGDVLATLRREFPGSGS